MKRIWILGTAALLVLGGCIGGDEPNPCDEAPDQERLESLLSIQETLNGFRDQEAAERAERRLRGCELSGNEDYMVVGKHRDVGGAESV